MNVFKCLELEQETRGRPNLLEYGRRMWEIGYEGGFLNGRTATQREAKKEWQGLTKDDFYYLQCRTVIGMAYAVERILKEKNT